MGWESRARERSANQRAKPPAIRTLWPFGFNVLIFAGYASVGPFYVLLYQDLGFSGTQIGLLLETYGGRVLYVVFGGIVLVVVAVVTLLRRTLGLTRE